MSKVTLRIRMLAGVSLLVAGALLPLPAGSSHPARAGASWSAADSGLAFPGFKGETVRLADYRGKWLLVNFWAPWCPPCYAEFPHLNQIARSRDIAVVGIAMDYGPDPERARRVAASLNYANVLGGNRHDPESAAHRLGPVYFYPVSYLFNPKGRFVAQLSGLVNETRVRAAVAESKRN